MRFPQLTENTPRVYGSMVEIDADPSYQPGMMQNEEANKEIFDSNPLFAVNARNAIKQFNRQQTAESAGANSTQMPTGTFGDIPPVAPSMAPFKAQEEAVALATLGRASGSWANEGEIATAFRRQTQRTIHGGKKYEAALENLWSKYGQKILEFGPEELAELIDQSDGGFEDESAKFDFVRNATEFHASIGVSPYHALRTRLTKRLPEYDLGQSVYMRVKASSKEKPFRFTDDEDGLKAFRAYRVYHDTQMGEVLGGNSTDIFYTIVDMLSNAVKGPFQAVDPDSIISDEWKADPVKRTRALTAIGRVVDIDKRFRGRSAQIGGEGERAVRIAKEAGRFENIPSGDFVITDPSSSITQAFQEENGAIQELLELEKLGAFGKRSRLSPVVGLVDSMMYSTSALTGLAVYSTDPDSVVNISQSGFDGLSKKDREKAMLRRVNEAITFQEITKAWGEDGFIFPMGESWSSSNPQMIRSYGEMIDPFMAAGVFKWARHLKRAGMTKAAVETELLRNTDRLRKLANTSFDIPPEVRQIVNNVRNNVGLPAEELAKLSDWDVLDIIARGNGRIADVLPDGNISYRPINASEFSLIADKMDEFSSAQALARQRRARGLARLAEKNKDGVFSQFGAAVSENFPIELRGIKDLAVFKSVIGFFKNVRKSAQEMTPLGQEVIQTAPNKSIAYGISKGIKGVAMASGINYVLSGGETANPLGGPGAYIASIYYINDILSVMEFSGDKGKFIAEYLQATSTGRQVNGSVSAWKINEKAAAIDRFKLRLSEKLTDAERADVVREMENLKSEIVTWRRFQSVGFEKSMLFVGNTTWNGLTSGAVLDVMMEANDRNSTGAFALAGTMSIINAGFGSLYRNFNSGRIRADQQRSVFAYNLMNMDPVQAQRALETYRGWREKGFGDHFVAYINQAYQNKGSNQSVQLVTPAEMQVASTIISSGDMLANVDGNQFQMKQNLIEEYRASNPTGSAAEAEAYANDKIRTLLEGDQANRAAVDKEKTYRGIEHALAVLGGELDNQTIEVQSALEVFVSDMDMIGIPKEKFDTISQSIRPENFSSPAAFRDFLSKLGVKWDEPSMFKDPDFSKKFNQFRGSLSEYLKLNQARVTGSVRFGQLEQALVGARQEAAAAADNAVNLSANKWRPGQTFLHTNYATGLTGTGTAIGNGVYIVDYHKTDNPDYDPADPNSQQTTHSSAILLDYTKFDPKTFYEEWGHRLFTSETFRDARTLLYRDAIGEWGYDNDGNYVMRNQGWAWVSEKDQSGKEVISFPLLRAFAESYSAKLPPEMAQSYMAEFDMAVERFNENPMANHAMMMPVFNELFANAYAQRMLSIDPSTGKIWSDPSSPKAGLEGSPMMPYSESGVTIKTLGKVLFGKLFSGELTITETASVLRALRSGSTSELTPESRNFLLSEVSSAARWMLSKKQILDNHRNPDGSVNKESLNNTLLALLDSKESEIQAAVGLIDAQIADGIRQTKADYAAGRINRAQAVVQMGQSFIKSVINDGTFQNFKFKTEAATDQMAALGVNAFENVAAVFFGKGGTLDNLIVKGANDRLLAMGLSPEIYGTGGWETGVIFDENGNPANMPGNISRLVDMVRYNTRTRVGAPDPLLMSEIDFWNDDGSFSPEKSSGVDIVLWAAYHNKSHWLDPKSRSRFKPKAKIIEEQNRTVGKFMQMLDDDQRAGGSQGVNIVKGENGTSINGRFTANDVKRFKSVLTKSDFHPSEKRYLFEVIDAMSESTNNQVPAFVINYKSMQFASVNSRSINTRKGGYDSTRSMVPISIVVHETPYDFSGKKLPNNQKMSMLYVRGADLDALNRRSTLAWNGSLLDEKGVQVVDKDTIHSVFGGDGKLYWRTVLDYLSLISTGGDIGPTKGTTSYPKMSTVEMLTQKILLEPGKYGLGDGAANKESVSKLAQKMAEIVHGTVGSPNIDALKKKEKKLLEAGGAEDGLEIEDIAAPVLNDNERGRIRLFEKDRSIAKPKWGMRDKNFLITDFRLDRIIGMRQSDKTIPWSPNSYAWAQVAYGAKSPNAWVSVRKGSKPITGVGLHIHDIVAASEEQGKQLTDIGVVDIWEHGSGYRMLLTGAGTYRVYDQGGVYVGEQKTIGRAKEMAVAYGNGKPISTRHPFDKQMVEFGFTPQGIQYVVPKGSFVRRSRYVSGDGKLMITFTNGGQANVFELSSSSAKISGPRLIARGVEVDADGKGGFDTSEIQAALEFASDEMTYNTPITYEVIDELTGNATNVETNRRDVRPVFENVNPELLEFMPIMIGQSINGTKVFAKSNPAYYTFKRRLIDYLGNYKKANEVIKQMRKDLGDQVVETDSAAVASWVEGYINDKQAELDRVSQAAQDKAQAKADAKLQTSVLDPIAVIFAGASAQAAAQGFPPVTRINPAFARESLVASVNQFSARAIAAKQNPLPNASTNPNFQTVEGEARNRLITSLNNAALEGTAARNQIGQVITQMWVNSSGSILKLELLPSAPVVGGIQIDTPGIGSMFKLPENLTKYWGPTNSGKENSNLGFGSGRENFGFGRKKEPNTARYRWTIYNPAGAVMGHYRSKEEAFEQLIRNDEESRKRMLDASRKARGGK